MNVSGSGLWNVAANAPGGTASNGGAALLNIGSGNKSHQILPATAPSISSAAERSIAGGGVTIGNVYSQGGSTGLLNLERRPVGFGQRRHQRLVRRHDPRGSGGTLAASSGTLQNVTEILGSVTHGHARPARRWR